LKPGDLVRMREVYTTASGISNHSEEFFVGSLGMTSPGFPIPAFSVGVVVKVVKLEDHPDETVFHVMVPDGRVGWIYPEDCEAIDEASP
jgi:hypothetical protein